MGTNNNKTELTWPGKSADFERVSLPFQCIETIQNGKRITKTKDDSLDLFENYEPQFSQNGNWYNLLIWGENKYVMSSLLKDFEGKIDLIYIDPPFATGADFSFRIMKNTKLVGCFFLLYPKLKEYVFNYCFGEVVGLDEENLTLILNHSSIQQELIDYFTQLINELTTETREFEIEKLPIQLSKTKTFIWRRKRTPCQKTVFNLVPIYNDFEGQFAQFLDSSEDILRFAKLAEWFTEFRVDYLNHKKASSYYYPDFIAVQRDFSGNEINWVIETKGWEHEDVALKDRAIEQWCDRITSKTGVQWKYLKVRQTVFDKGNWVCFGDLVGEINKRQWQFDN